MPDSPLLTGIIAPNEDLRESVRTFGASYYTPDCTADNRIIHESVGSVTLNGSGVLHVGGTVGEAMHINIFDTMSRIDETESRVRELRSQVDYLTSQINVLQHMLNRGQPFS